MVENIIVGNTVEMLDSFDSRTIKIVDSYSKNDEKCTIYDNGRIIYENKNFKYILHIDIDNSSSYGFVKSDKHLKIYKCFEGVLTIYDMVNKDNKEYILPNRNCHVVPNSVNIFKGVVYSLVGNIVNVNDNRVKYGIVNGDYTIFHKNEEDYVIDDVKLMLTHYTDSKDVDNKYTVLSEHTILFRYNIVDYSVGDSGISIVTDDGYILHLDNKNIITTKKNNFRYYPQLLAYTPDEINKLHVIYDYHNIKYDTALFTSNYKGNFPYYYNSVNHNSDDTFNFAEIRNPLGWVDDSGYEFLKVKNLMDLPKYNNFNKHIISCSVFKTDNVNPTYVQKDSINKFKSSNKYDVDIASLGKNGLILNLNGESIIIDNVQGFPINCEVYSALMGSDGFLYIALTGSGYVLKNLFKNDYSIFTDILCSSYVVEDGNIDINTAVKYMVDDGFGGIWFYARGSHLLPSGDFADNLGLYCYNYNTGIVTDYNIFNQSTTSLMFDTFEKSLSCTDNKVIATFGIDMFVYDVLDKTLLRKFSIQSFYPNISTIVGYKNKFISINNTNDIVSFSFPDNMVGELIINKIINVGGSNLGDTTMIRTSQPINKKPYISDTLYVDGFHIHAMFGSESYIKIFIHNPITMYNYEAKLLVISLITKDTRIKLSEIGGVITLEVINHKDILDKNLWTFKISDNISFNHDKYYNSYESTDYKLISESLSPTDVVVTEGFISGDNLISDFGDLNKVLATKFKIPGRMVGTTPNMIKVIGNYTHDLYDRFTGDKIVFRDIINVPPKYAQVFLLECGVGRLDARVYITVDSIGGYNLINEYHTNNHDVDIIPLLNFIGKDLLGVPFPGGSIYNNVDYWFIGETNNSAIGIILDQNYINIKTIVVMNIKTQFAVDVSSANINITEVLLENLSFYDNNLEDILMYNKIFKTSIFSITVNGINRKEIVERGAYVPRNINNNERVISICNPNNDIDHNQFFLNKNSFIRTSIGNNLTTGFKVDPITPIGDVFDENGFCSVNLVKSTDLTPIAVINQINLDRANLFSKLEIVIEFDKSYGFTSTEIIDFVSLFVCKVSINGVVDDTYMYIDSSSDKSVTFYLNSVGTFKGDVVIYSIYVDNSKITKALNYNFRIFSTDRGTNIFGSNIQKTSISPDYPAKNHKWITDEYFTNNYKYTTISQDQRSGTYNNCKNILNIRNNISSYRLSTFVTIDMAMLDSFNHFKIFNIGGFEVKIQRIANVNDPYLIGLGLISRGNGNCLNFALLPPASGDYVNHTFTVYVKCLSYNSATITLFVDSVKLFSSGVLTFTSKKSTYCELLNQFHGYIYDINLIENVFDINKPDKEIFDKYEYDSYNGKIFGDNISGNVVALVRDFKSGDLKALISPDSSGPDRGRGLQEYSYKTGVGFNKNMNNKPTKNIPDNLNFGDIGYSENSAFKLITFKHPLTSKLINIYDKKVIEHVIEFGTCGLEFMSGDVIYLMDGQIIESSEFEI